VPVYCYLLVAFFCLAHRAFTAAAIRFRPAGVSLYLFLAGLLTVETAFGLPGPRLVPASPASNDRTCFNLAISPSISANIISDNPMGSPLGLYYPVVYGQGILVSQESLRRAVQGNPSEAQGAALLWTEVDLRFVA